MVATERRKKRGQEQVLVTGGAGYIGSGVVRVLLDSGYRVVCVDRLSFGAESLLTVWDHEAFLFKKMDITDFDAVDHVFEEFSFSAVVHLAAVVGDPACRREPERAMDVNWNASLHLLELARKHAVPRFVFASTCSNYGKMADRKGFVNEESPLSPVSLYASLKVQFEQVILKEMQQTDDFCPACLRFATVYGLSPRMRFDLTVNEFTKDLVIGKGLQVYGEQFWRPYCHVRDFARAIVTVLSAPREKVRYNVFNVGDTTQNFTKKMIVEELLKQVPGGRVEYVEKEEDPRDYRVDFSKIRRELQFKISRRIPQGIAGIISGLVAGVIPDPENQRYYNIPHQRWSAFKTERYVI